MFQISPLQRSMFDEWLALDEASLARRGAKRCIVDANPGYPCRVSLEDAEIGERVILLPFEHQPASSPYRATGPIFVREAAQTASVPANTVPALLRTRILSVKAYDREHLMIGAEIVDGRELEPALTRTFANAQVSYIHLHLAKAGCYACRVDRTADEVPHVTDPGAGRETTAR